MQKLVAQLARLYLAEGMPPRLATVDGLTRAIVIAFDKQTGGEAQHWSLLCEVANALQTELGLPAPAVSISGAHGFRLWLSLQDAAPAATVHHFLDLLRTAYCPEFSDFADVTATVAVPPCLNADTGLWAAFINPGLGASFADESGLEMEPPHAGQLPLLEGLHSISAAQFAQAIALLEKAHGVAAPAVAAAPKAAPPADGLLLQDASLEDIVKHLHRLNIEPTFRHLIN